MTKLMEKALNAVRAWPADRQDEAAKLLLALDRLGERDERASKLDELMSKARQNHNAGRREEF
jgi:hypothetical protein